MSLLPWNRFYPPLTYFADATGVPLGGGKLYFYQTGTSTPLDTYSDAGLTTPNTNPVVADQSGIFGPIFLASQSYKVVLTDSLGNIIWTADPVSPYVASANPLTPVAALVVVVDGVGAVPNTGIARDLYVPFAFTITGSVLQATTSGSLVLDIWGSAFVAGTPPTVLNSIVASAPPTLSTENSSIDTTLTGWTKSISAGTWLRYNINSVATLTAFTHTLFGTIG